uniref:Uncharacterized protein n=1 Tax=Rhizophora mucronata TaxID=61149 RepID=A0A2P2PRC5_RHIMU
MLPCVLKDTSFYFCDASDHCRYLFKESDRPHTHTEYLFYVDSPGPMNQ